MIAPDPAHDSWLGWVPWHPPAGLRMPPPHANPPPDQLMTMQQLAAYLQIAPVTLYRHVKQGLIPYTRVGGVYRFNRGTIEAWLRGQTA